MICGLQLLSYAYSGQICRTSLTRASQAVSLTSMISSSTSSSLVSCTRCVPPCHQLERLTLLRSLIHGTTHPQSSPQFRTLVSLTWRCVCYPLRDAHRSLRRAAMRASRTCRLRCCCMSAMGTRNLHCILRQRASSSCRLIRLTSHSQRAPRHRCACMRVLR